MENRKRKMNDEGGEAIAWRDVPLNKIFKIKHTKDVKTKSEFSDSPSLLVRLSDEEGNTINTWATSRLTKDLRNIDVDKTTNLYLKSLGKRDYNIEDGRYTYDYDLVQM